VRFVDVYFDYKKKYNNYIILSKIGNFYNIFGDDAQIIYLLTGYKINYDKNIIKVGFPVVSLEKVLKKLHEEKINYIVLEKIDGVINIKIKKRFNDNMYAYFADKCLQCYEYKLHIESIYNKLNSKIYDHNIKKVLEQIDRLL